MFEEIIDDGCFDRLDYREEVFKQKNTYNPWKTKYWIHDNRSKWAKILDLIRFSWLTGRYSDGVCWMYQEDRDSEEQRRKDIYEYERKHHTVHTEGFGCGISPVRPSHAKVTQVPLDIPKYLDSIKVINEIRDINNLDISVDDKIQQANDIIAKFFNKEMICCP